MEAPRWMLRIRRTHVRRKAKIEEKRIEGESHALHEKQLQPIKRKRKKKVMINPSFVIQFPI